MSFDRNEVAASALAAKLKTARLGVLVRELDGVDELVVAKVAQDQIGRSVHLVITPWAREETPPENVHTNIESAVALRNDPAVAGAIVAFVSGDVPKTHSLSEFDELTSRDVAAWLCMRASDTLSGNQPRQRFWEALEKSVGNFPLNMIESFVNAIEEDPEPNDAIPRSMWRLGLLRDDAVLHATTVSVEARLSRNRDLLLRLGQLSEMSRKRMTAAIARASPDESSRLRSGFQNVMEFYRRGGEEVLKRLDVQTVEELVDSGKARKRSETQPSPEPAVDSTPNDPESLPAPEETLRGRDLTRAVAGLVIEGGDAARSGLRQLGDSIRQQLSSPQSTPVEIPIEEGFGRGVQYKPSQETRSIHALMGAAAGPSAWGGVLTSQRAELKEVVRSFLPQELTPFDPEDPQQGVAGQTVFSLIRGFDDLLPELPQLGDLLDRMIAARSVLFEHLDLLVAEPLVLFGGYLDARQALEDYVCAYSGLLRLLCTRYAALSVIDANAVRLVNTELLRLDVVHVKTPTEWKAILTPLHPFHLWRFREIFASLDQENRELTDEDKHQLSKALPSLPHLLHFVVFSPEVAPSEDIHLPQSGVIGLLPTYENKTNRFLGPDGLDELPKLLRRWVEFAPYSRAEVRVAIVDPPDVSSTIRYVADFVKANACSVLSLDLYLNERRNGRGDLARLDYDDHDQDVAELLMSRRLRLRTEKFENQIDLTEKLSRRPVHLGLLFDQSNYNLSNAPRARDLVVSPLVITYKYEYSRSFRRGTISPSSEAQDGLFADYHYLIERAARLPAGQQIRLQYEGGATVEPINGLVESDTVRWLAIADRTIAPYSPRAAVPLAEQRVGNRELGVWAGRDSYAVARLVTMLKRFNLQPRRETVATLLGKFGHIASNGVLSLPSSGGNVSSRDSAEKGLLGTILAAAWYAQAYPGALVASLDSSFARQWLSGRPEGGRADLVGIRRNEEGIIVESIEVKTRVDDPIRVDQTPNGRRLSGLAIDQLETMLTAIEPIFGICPSQPLFTAARREALKYQLYRECFRDVYEPSWQQSWFETLEMAFHTPQALVQVDCSGLVIHVLLEEAGSTQTVTDTARPIRLVRLKTDAVQDLVGALQAQSAPEGVPPVELPEVDAQDGEDEGGGPNASRESEPSPISPVGSALDTTTEVSGGPEGVDSPPSPPPPARQQEKDGLDRTDAVQLSRSFLRACQSFRIQVDSCDPSRAVQGPTVWRFYVRLSRGQRLDPVKNALEDIGREMGRSGLLVTTIPNSQEIALDVPRLDRERVPLLSGLEHLPAIQSPEQMPIPIGITPEGNHIIRDLGQLPHLLVAGTTGSGKTMFLYSLLLSLLAKHRDPLRLRLILSTSGPEDFVFFDGLPHLETGSVITEASDAIEILQNHVAMASEERQSMLTSARCRDVVEYNSLHSAPIPPLVVVVDEFADLVDQLGSNRAAKELFYGNIRRIAQIGRKRGIHLVLCTQRPSADLVPTNIRNLMNGRVGLHVNDATASRMILDEGGAEQLQMHGDLLFKEQGALTRAQGYFTSTSTIEDMLRGIRGAF